MKSNKGFSLVFILIGILIIIMVGASGYFVWHQQASVAKQNTQKNENNTNNTAQSSTDYKKQDVKPNIDKPNSEKYQAVYLSDGNIYFGELTALSDGSFELAKVFYLNGGEYEGNGKISYKNNVNVSLDVLYKNEYSTKKLTLTKQDVIKWEDMDSSSEISNAIVTYKKDGLMQQ